MNPMKQQTSVLISATAIATLKALTKTGGSSRDATLRALLEQYVQKQTEHAKAGRDQRVTHIGTALHYPLCLREPVGLPERTRLHRLALRAPPSLLAAAQLHAYRIPGHVAGRGHPDYASRPLGDAVTTAISLETPFVEPELEGLPHVVEHRVVDALWHFTRAATMTHTEWTDLGHQMPQSHRGDLVAQFVQRVATFLAASNTDYMWHSPDRSAVALAIARAYLGSADPEKRSILKDRGPDFESEINYLLDEATPGHPDDDVGAVGLVTNAEGRAASRFWVRDRAQAHQRLMSWLVDTHDTDRASPVINPPGWTLHWESSWRTATFGLNDHLPSAVHVGLASGNLLRVDHGSRTTIWPLTEDSQPTTVPGFNHVIAGMHAARPTASAIEIIEACLAGPNNDPDSNVENEDTSPPIYLWLDLQEAHELALIDDHQYRSRASLNRAENEARMNALMREPRRRWGGSLSTEMERTLEEAKSTDVDLFFDLVERSDLHTSRESRRVVERWEWPVFDLRTAITIYEGATLEAFARCRMNAVRVSLHQANHQAWMDAMWWSWQERL